MTRAFRAILGRRRRVDPTDTRYVETWRSDDVARQMAELTRTQLEHPEDVAPYAAFRRLLAPLLDEPELPQPARLLDVGAGAGAYGELLERWWPGRFAYTGADYSGEVLACARILWPGRSFVRCDVLEPGALDGFDVVLAGAVVDVLPDPEEALRALVTADAPWVILHRQRIHSAKTSTTVTVGYRGQWTYSTRLARDDLERIVADAGRKIAGEVTVERDVRSFLLAST